MTKQEYCFEKFKKFQNKFKKSYCSKNRKKSEQFVKNNYLF